MKASRLGALALLAAVLACEPPPRAHEPAATPQSSTIVTAASGRIVAVDADHDAVVFMDADGGNVRSVPVGQRPAQLAIRGERVLVTNRGARSVTLLSTRDENVVRTFKVGVEPVGVAWVDDRRAAVSLGGEQALALVDVDAGQVVQRVALAHQEPRAVAVLPDGRIFVSHLTTDKLSVVQGGEVRELSLRLRSMPHLTPNLVQSLAVRHDGKEVATSNVELNNEQVNADRPVEGGGGGGYLGTPEQLPAVTPAVTTVDTDLEVTTADTVTADIPNVCFENCGQVDPAEVGRSALLRRENGQTESHQVNEPTAVAYLDGGRGFAVLARGSNNLLIWRRDSDGRRTELVKAVKVGSGADGLAASPDGRALYVHSAFDQTVDVVEVPLFEEKQQKSSLAGGLQEASHPKAPVEQEQPARRMPVAALDLPADVLAGRKLFFDATNNSMTTGPGVTCATCHPDGRADRKTWNFIDGPRNTMSLAGGIATTTAPLHWGGELQSHRELQRTITEFMGGHGLPEDGLDQLAAFIDTVPTPDNVNRDDDTQRALQLRGEELFFDERVGCASCHAGNHRTDNLNHDVGTGGAFQTPVLHGLHLSSPYLHDGTAPTVEDVLEKLVKTDLMGRGSHLSAEDMTALAAYLRTL
ncbi:MAG: hypothetical protein AB2A00_33670 [Myxococcota bacterium]